MRRRSERGSPHFRASVEPIREVLSMRNIVPKDPRIQRALDLLQENRPQSDNVAMALNLSASRFRHLFKEELGISPHHYLLCARLHRARELLENSAGFRPLFLFAPSFLSHIDESRGVG